MPSSSVSRTALLASVNLAALPAVRLSTLSLSLASGNSLMMRLDRRIAAGGQIIAPQHVDQFRARLEHHRLSCVPSSSCSDDFDLVEHAGLFRLDSRSDPASAACRRDICRSWRGASACGRRRWRADPSSSAGRNRRWRAPAPNGRPASIGSILAISVLGARRIGAEHAGDEADIGARGFGVLERLHAR